MVRLWYLRGSPKGSENGHDAIRDFDLREAYVDRQVGDIEHRITWPKAINGGNTALVDDCMDTSKSGSYETSTGDKTTTGTDRLHVQGNLIKGEDGIWLVAQNYFLKDEPC